MSKEKPHSSANDMIPILAKITTGGGSCIRVGMLYFYLSFASVVLTFPTATPPRHPAQSAMATASPILASYTHNMLNASERMSERHKCFGLKICVFPPLGLAAQPGNYCCWKIPDNFPLSPDGLNEASSIGINLELIIFHTEHMIAELFLVCN